MNDIPPEEGAQPDEPFWSRPLSLDFRGFFAGLAKATVFSTMAQWVPAAAEATDALAAVGLARTPPQLAGALLQRAMTRATYDLLRTYLRDFSTEVDAQVERLGRQIEEEIAETPIPLNETFFDRPRDIPLVDLFQAKLANWLECRQVGEHAAQTIAGRLPAYFVYAMHQELRENRIDYGPLVRFVDTRVADAWRKERTWHAYRLSFERDLDGPVFDEGFSLRQIFLGPSAYFVKRPPPEPRASRAASVALDQDDPTQPRVEERVVVDLREALDAWLEMEDREDAIRVVSGDPGSGKSSFVRMYAQHRMERGDRVLVVPLHTLNVLDDLDQSVENYCGECDDCPTGLLKAETAESRLLLVLDGLDELSKQGVIGAAIAGEFIDEVTRKVGQRNRLALRLRVILSGRTIAVQNVAAKLRGEGQVLHMLPFYVREQEQEGESERYQYVAGKERLEADLRDEWWRRYGRLKGTDYDGLPAELCGDRLDDVTSQPLLNYLVALVYRRGKVDFGRDVSRNEIYDDLVDRVYERDWDPAGRSKAVAGIDRADFRALLKEMALTAWHDRERTTTEKAVRVRCAGRYLEDVLNRYERRCDQGVSQLFTAFYFRKGTQVVGPEPTFEFTHKSFGEYLTASRIVDGLAEVHDELGARQGERRRAVGVWNEARALEHWLDVCGPTAISLDLMEYVRNEVQLRAERKTADPAAWQETLRKLIDESLARGMPCERLSGGLTFHEMSRRARNADEALLVLHSCCADLTHQISKIDWPRPTSAGEWIHRLRGQRTWRENRAALCALNGLDFAGQILDLVDLYCADLRKSRLDRASLRGANLVRANLDGASLNGASVVGANLSDACVDGARLEGARLVGARLEGASLLGARLDRARLDRAWLGQARLHAARLVQASLDGANLDGASLGGASLEGAIVSEEQLRVTVGTPAVLPDGTRP